MMRLLIRMTPAITVVFFCVLLVPYRAVAQTAGCSGQQAPPVTAPSQAKSAGFGTLVFDDEFNSANTISPDNTGQYNWYTYSPYGSQYQLPASGYQVKNGCLTILTDASGFSSGLMTINSTHPTTGIFNTGYFEARIQFSPTGSRGGAWPGFWSNAIEQVQGGSPYAELEFFEAYPGGSGGATNGKNGVTLIDTVHQWTVTSSGNVNVQNNENVPTLPPGFNYNVFHIYGCLWTSDQITWYVDNIPVLSVPIDPLDGFTAIQQDHMFVILGTGKNWPMTVDYVRIWGGKPPG